MPHIKVEIETDTDTYEVIESLMGYEDTYRVAFDVAVQRARKVLEAVT